jgi:hypothetical protein
MVRIREMLRTDNGLIEFSMAKNELRIVIAISLSL